MNTTFIYALCCPCTGEVRYIGKSNKPKDRLKAHIWSGKRAQSSYKRNWIDKLKSKGFRPELLVLEETIVDNWKEREKHYIKYYKDLGCKLTNHCSGGEGLTFGNQTSFKKGCDPANKGKAFKKPCSICEKLFEVSPSEYKKYKCCSMKCSIKYRSLNPNKGCFKKGSIPWSKGRKLANNNGRSKPVIQFDINNGKVLNTFPSAAEAERKTGINQDCITNNINRRSKSAGGFTWRRLL